MPSPDKRSRSDEDIRRFLGWAEGDAEAVRAGERCRGVSLRDAANVREKVLKGVLKITGLLFEVC